MNTIKKSSQNVEGKKDYPHLKNDNLRHDHHLTPS